MFVSDNFNVYYIKLNIFLGIGLHHSLRVVTSSSIKSVIEVPPALLSMDKLTLLNLTKEIYISKALFSLTQYPSYSNTCMSQGKNKGLYNAKGEHIG